MSSSTLQVQLEASPANLWNMSLRRMLSSDHLLSFCLLIYCAHSWWFIYPVRCVFLRAAASSALQQRCNASLYIQLQVSQTPSLLKTSPSAVNIWRLWMGDVTSSPVHWWFQVVSYTVTNFSSSFAQVEVYFVQHRVNVFPQTPTLLLLRWHLLLVCTKGRWTHVFRRSDIDLFADTNAIFSTCSRCACMWRNTLKWLS